MPTAPIRLLAFRLCILLLVALVSACEIRERSGDEDAEADGTGTTTAPIEESVDQALPAPDPDDDRSVAQRLEDASVAARVKLALADEQQLRLLDFDPEVREGVVYLSGDVPSSTHFTLAEQVARRVQGVRGVENALVAPDIDPPPSPSVDTVGATPSAPDTNSNTPPPGSSGPASATASDQPEAQYHTVASGESLWEIARANGTSIDAIRRLNNLQGDRLRVGQRLRVR